MTFSLLAVSDDGRQLGLAAASCGLFTGSIIPFFDSTRHFIGISQAYPGESVRRALQQLAPSKLPRDAILDKLKGLDSRIDYRQFAYLARSGERLIHSGDKVTPQAGFASGEHSIAIGNLLISSEGLEMMCNVYEQTGKDVSDYDDAEHAMAERMLQALSAFSEIYGQEAEGRRLRERASVLVILDLNGLDTDIRIDCEDDAVAKLINKYRLYRKYKKLMEICEYEPSALPDLTTQDEMLSEAPSIFADGGV